MRRENSHYGCFFIAQRMEMFILQEHNEVAKTVCTELNGNNKTIIRIVLVKIELGYRMILVQNCIHCIQRILLFSCIFFRRSFAGKEHKVEYCTQ